MKIKKLKESIDNFKIYGDEETLRQLERDLCESINEDVPMEYIDPNILKSLADEDEYYNKQRERRIHNFELLHKIFDSHGYRDSEERWTDKVFDLFRNAQEITVVDDASKVPSKTNDAQKVKYVFSTPDAEVDVHADVYGDYVWVVTKDPITEAFYDTNKSLNEDVAEEDKFILYLPHLKPRTVDKETAIKSLEQKLNAFKSNDGSDIAGTGFAIYCLQSIDKDGTSWVANYSSREFIKSLTYLSESVEDAYINEKFVDKDFHNNLSEDLSGKYSDKFRQFIRSYTDSATIVGLVDDIVRYAKEDDLKDLYFERGYDTLEVDEVTDYDLTESFNEEDTQTVKRDIDTEIPDMLYS